MRIDDQGPRQGHTFLHSPGELRGVPVGGLAKFGLFNSSHDPAVDFRFIQVRRFPKREGDIFMHGHGVEERIVLKHVAYSDQE